MVRQDFACISSKAKNKELDLWAEKSFGAKGIDDDTEEEAETKVGTSATGEDDQGQASIFRHVREQRDDEKRATEKSVEEEGKMILVRKKIRKTGRKIMRRLHKH